MKRDKKSENSTLSPGRDANSPLSILLVVAPYYEDITNLLLEGARFKLDSQSIRTEILEVPGALEIPPAIKLASDQNIYDGYVALGCVIRGETIHFEIVAGESARGIMDLGLEGLCIGNGILTVETLDQAVVRANPKEGNKGGEAVEAALRLIAFRKQNITRYNRFSDAKDG